MTLGRGGHRCNPEVCAFRAPRYARSREGCPLATVLRPFQPVTALPAPVEEVVAARAVADLLAHDLRTPLNAVRGFADLLLAGAAGPLTAAQLELIAEIAHAGRVLEAAVATAQELCEPAPGGSEGAGDLVALLAEAGFTLASPGRGTPRAAWVGDAGLWRRLLHACRDHLGVEGGSPPSASLRAGAGNRVELAMERHDISGRWQMSSLRERQISRLAGSAGAEILSQVPHTPLLLRLCVQAGPDAGG